MWSVSAFTLLPDPSRPPPPSNALRIPNIIALHTFGLPVQGTLLPSEFQKATRGIGIDIFFNHPVAKSHQCQLYCFVFLVRLTPPPPQKKKNFGIIKTNLQIIYSAR